MINNINIYTKQFKTKGNLVYEYNPFYNYRINEIHYICNDIVYTKQELENFLNSKYNKTGYTIAKEDGKFILKKDNESVNLSETIYEFEPGQLLNFETSELEFDIQHPVSVLPQYSYDGSVNLIVNDGKSFPKLINSRFSAREKNTYEIVDRNGNDDTNIYDQGNQFNIDVSLFKQYVEIPKVDFFGTFSGGYVPIGNYFFYFKYADADGNETDFVAESGLVSVFIGNTNVGAHTGVLKQSSNKLIKFVITNVDSAYSKCIVYGVRNSCTQNGTPTTEAFKILKDYNINRGGFCNIIITGLEEKQEISISELNIQHVTVDSAATQAVAKNRLFLGNIKRTKIPQEELADLSLRFLPKLFLKPYDLTIDENYTIESAETGYYDPKYIYDYVGYWDEEYYRLGIVYILKDNSLSDVFNIRGHGNLHSGTRYNHFPVQTNGNRNYINYDSVTNRIISGNVGLDENIKGVIYIDETSDITDQIIHFKIETSQAVLTELGKYAKGFFFVRQKRIPTTLAQALTIAVDNCSGTPLIGVGSSQDNTGFTESQLKNFDSTYSANSELFLAERFLTNDRILLHNYQDRLYPISKVDIKQYGAICPDYDVDYPTLNAYLTGDINAIKYSKTQPKQSHFTRDLGNERHYYNIEYEGNSNNNEPILNIPIIGVQDNDKLLAVKDFKFSARAGMGEEAFQIAYLKSKSRSDKANNLMRASYGPFLGLGSSVLQPGKLIDIKIPNFNAGQHDTYMQIRFEDKSPYYAISERFALKEFQASDSEESVQITNLFRGDCYLCQFTHRINRNFQDSTSPTNDIIIDQDTWKTNYSVSKVEDLNKINLGDVNAVKIGSWVTFRVRSSKNLNIRTLDESNIDEAIMFGHPRGFYPQLEMSDDGMYKIPEALIYNKGFEVSVGNQANYNVPEVPYLKDNFETRIMYSELNVNDSFQNGFRVFNATNFVDYPRTYGSITKLVEIADNLLCVFEHGVAIIPIQERVVAGEGIGGNVFINTNEVLPNTLEVLSDKFGSQWIESIVKTSSFVYGVDTVAKKIWRSDGENFEIISDLKIQKFLVDHISLKERENYPIVGIRNVKTHYNAHKDDVLFTFYDNLYGHQEEIWNICFNELLNKWITFYSWVPSYSENIDNMYFSFDRNTSKKIAKLGISKSNNDFSNGIVLSENVYNDYNKNYIIPKDTTIGTISHTEDLNIIAQNLNGQSTILIYKLEKSPYNIQKYFTVDEDTVELKTTKNIYLNQVKYEIIGDDVYLDTDIIYLNIALIDSDDTSIDTIYSKNVAKYLQSTIAISTKCCVDKLTTDFWKHGQSGIIDIKDTLKPTFWYGKQHPFEFEFVALDNIHLHKIFTNLLIVSNKAAPESFHYEIVGECYAFKHAKRNAYIRQEMTNHLYQVLQSNIEFDTKYMKLEFDKDVKKSVKFPLYYKRLNTINNVEDAYVLATSESRDYRNLSGTEVIYDQNLNEFRLVNHSPAIDISNGRIRGNMQYNEDKWEVKLNPIIFEEKNEDLSTKLPLVINTTNIPSDIVKDTIDPTDITAVNENYTLDDIQIQDESWTVRKEVRPKDKYIKIKIRYSGEDLAIINMIKTIYTVSYG